eukprot:6188612-Pleurochrysis_carterae.AAC.1
MAPAMNGEQNDWLGDGQRGSQGGERCAKRDIYRFHARTSLQQRAFSSSRNQACSQGLTKLNPRAHTKNRTLVMNAAKGAGPGYAWSLVTCSAVWNPSQLRLLRGPYENRAAPLCAIVRRRAPSCAIARRRALSWACGARTHHE